MVVAFTTWRLFANLRALFRALSSASGQLLPALNDLQQQAAAAATTAAQLQTRTPPAAGSSTPGPQD